MKKRTKQTERFKVNSIKFLSALKPKIRSKKRQSDIGESNGARLLLGKLDKKLNRFPGTA